MSEGSRVSGRRGSGFPAVLERAGTLAADIDLPGAHHPRARLAVQCGIGVLVMGFLVGFVASQWSKLPDFDFRFSPGWLVLASITVVTYLIIQGEIWRLILRSLGERLDDRSAQVIYAKSLLARYVPSNALMVVSRIVMAGHHRVRRRVCLASLAYEVGLALCASAIMGSYFVITLPALEGEPARYAILGLIPLGLTVMHPRVFEPVANYALAKLGRESLPKSLSFPSVLLFTLLYLIDLAVIGIAVFAFASALYPVSAAVMSSMVSAYAVGFCVAVLTFFVPGGSEHVMPRSRPPSPRRSLRPWPSQWRSHSGCCRRLGSLRTSRARVLSPGTRIGEFVRNDALALQTRLVPPLPDDAHLLMPMCAVLAES